jgi:hypothetical protein
VKAWFLLSLGVVAVFSTDGFYRAGSAASVYDTENDYLLWFERDGQQLGQPIQTVGTETHEFIERGGELFVVVTTAGEGFENTTEFGIALDGTVLTANGEPVGQAEASRVDLLPRIPHSLEALRPGLTWTDSVSSEGEGPGGTHFYRGVREYSVIGEVETAGDPALLIVGEGGLELRQGFWQSPDETLAWWQEVAGPVIDSVWIDLGGGGVLRTAAHMDLKGEAGFESLAGEVLLPSGLRSSFSRIRLP